MKMIDVLKRLAELDSNNPNVINPNAAKPSSSLKECGGMMQPSQIPASLTISATAADGAEVSGMLMDIMKLAGVHKVDQSELGMEHDPVKMTMEPVIAATPEIHGEPEMGDMVGMIDRMNDDEESEEETDEGMWDNSPDESIEGYKAFQDHGDLAKNPAAGGNVKKVSGTSTRIGTEPTATVREMEDMEAQLYAEYRQFVSEGKMAEKFDMEPTKPSKKGMFKGKTKEQLEKQLAALKKKGPHKKDSPEYTKMKELQFAIRAKKKVDKWGKVSEGMEFEAYDESDDEDKMYAIVSDRHGNEEARYELAADDVLDCDEYANKWADSMGIELEGESPRSEIPDGMEDYSVRLTNNPEGVTVWDSKNYMVKDEIYESNDMYESKRTKKKTDKLGKVSESMEQGSMTENMDSILKRHANAVDNFKKGGELDSNLESDLWDYFYSKGDIKNYDAAASEYISDRLSNHLGLDETKSDAEPSKLDGSAALLPSELKRLAGIKNKDHK